MAKAPKAAKFQEPSDDTTKIFNQAIVATGLSNHLKIKILVSNSAKQIFKVSKANDIIQFMTGEEVLIIVNEQIFDQLAEHQKRIVAEEALAHVGYDMDNDKVIVTAPDFIAHSGILRKHSFATIEIVRESIKSLYASQKESEAENDHTT